MNANDQTFPLSAAGESNPAGAPAPRLPWYCFAVVFAAACIPVGVLWDISWHSTIGRDTFWTPAHMLTYFGGGSPGCRAAGWC